jgi:hypothetical protein
VTSYDRLRNAILAADAGSPQAGATEATEAVTEP